MLHTIKNRRSIYALGNDMPMSQEALDALIRDTIRHAPSAFNSQSTRTVQLFGSAHTRFWQIVHDALQKITPADKFSTTSQKIAGFSAGFATVLFYEAQDTVQNLQAKFPSYADNFVTWSEHANAMAQYALWLVMSAHHIGASLQHYNPIIDEKVAMQFDIPYNWKLCAQMVLGSIKAPAGEKQFIDDSIRFKTFFA